MLQTNIGSIRGGPPGKITFALAITGLERMETHLTTTASPDKNLI
jgi:hypothetical protein